MPTRFSLIQSELNADAFVIIAPFNSTGETFAIGRREPSLETSQSKLLIVVIAFNWFALNAIEWSGNFLSHSLN
jgi:hypothetical protein